MPTIAFCQRVCAFAISAWFERLRRRRRIGRREGAIDLLDVVGDTLGLGEKLLGSLDRLFQLPQRRERQGRQILRLIDQHLRLILQRHDLVVDLLQRASGGQHVLRIVVGIEHNQLRGGTVRDQAMTAIAITLAPARRRRRFIWTPPVQRDAG